MGTHTTLVGVVTVVVVATACGGASSTGGPADDAGPAPPVGAWALVDAEPAIEVPPDARVTLTIEDDGDGRLQVGGTAACNTYGGLLEAGGGTWHVERLSWTEMGCEPARMAAEAAYLDAFQRIGAWQVDGDTLVLTGDDVRLTFDRLAQVDQAALTGTTWVLDGLVSGSGDDASVSSVPADVEPAELRLEDDGTFTLFTGCRDFAGEWTTSGDELALPSWGQAEGSRGVAPNGDLDCGDDAEAQERTVLEVVEGGAVPMVEGDRLTLRRGGTGLVFRAG